MNPDLEDLLIFLMQIHPPWPNSSYRDEVTLIPWEEVGTIGCSTTRGQVQARPRDIIFQQFTSSKTGKHSSNTFSLELFSTGNLPHTHLLISPDWSSEHSMIGSKLWLGADCPISLSPCPSFSLCEVVVVYSHFYRQEGHRYRGDERVKYRQPSSLCVSQVLHIRKSSTSCNIWG